MTTINWRYFLIYVILFFSTTYSTKAQCEWLYENMDSGSYVLDGNNIVLFYCETFMDTIYAPSEYIDVYWEYTTDTGQECEDWDWGEDDFFFSVNYNDPCIEGNNTITVTFVGTTSLDATIAANTCVFDIFFNEEGNPYISLEVNQNEHNTNEQITVCDQDDIRLFADGLGSYPNPDGFEWYLNGELIEGENNIELNVMNTNYDTNSPNIFYFSVSNYCSSLSDDGPIESEWLTISIYEGYDHCEPCDWDLPDYENNEFYGFCIECEGDGYFPEKPNNEEHRSFDSENRHPTCEATIYRVLIYNRLGRKIFESDYDNHPWDGKLKNGRKFKEGTYYYQMEYVLNPFLAEDGQNETKISTGTVYLDWGN